MWCFCHKGCFICTPQRHSPCDIPSTITANTPCLPSPPWNQETLAVLLIAPSSTMPKTGRNWSLHQLWNKERNRFSWYDLGLQMAIVSGPSVLYVSLAIPPWVIVGNLNVEKNMDKACLPPSVLEKGAAGPIRTAPHQWLFYLPCS